jgi:3'(2'), 5'-bisphosphate nucleotidase
MDCKENNNNSQSVFKLKEFLHDSLSFCDIIDNHAKKIQYNNLTNNVHIKEHNQKYTDLDWLIQKSFENIIKTKYPYINIIGEENTSININIPESHELLQNTSNISLATNKLSSLTNFNEFDINIESDTNITLFIDPIDGTNALIKHKYEAVTVLIGICVNNKPLFGLIHFPFQTNKHKTPISYFNYPTQGVYEYQHSLSNLFKLIPQYKSLNEWNFIISSSRTKPSMLNFIANFNNANYIMDSGLGNKAIQSIINDYIYFTTGKGTISYWDICAGDCIAREIGGGCFDLKGKLIDYNNNNKDDWCVKDNVFFVSDKRRVNIFVQKVEELKYEEGD